MENGQCHAFAALEMPLVFAGQEAEKAVTCGLELWEKSTFAPAREKTQLLFHPAHSLTSVLTEQVCIIYSPQNIVPVVIHGQTVQFQD